AGFAHAQSDAATKPATELETFQGKTGSVIIKAYSDTEPLRGLGGTIQVSPIQITDAQTKAKSSGIVFEVQTGSGSYPKRGRSLVDSSEIEGLLQGIDYVAKVDATVTVLKRFEAKYTTKGHLVITVFNDDDGLNLGISCGYPLAESVYLK